MSDDNAGKKPPRKQYPPRDETPIEELYDLTKPIPKEDKPSKEEHEKQLAEITAEIDQLKEKRNKIQAEIEKNMNDPAEKEALQEARNKLNTIKAQKNKLIEQKKNLRAKLDENKNQTDKIIKDKKDARSNVKYSSLEEIDAAIAKLKKQQETTTMTLNEEKKLIKEIDTLIASKKFVADVKSKDQAMDSAKEQRKNIAQEITTKDKEIDALTKEIDEIMKIIKEFNDKMDQRKDSNKALFQQRDEVRQLVGDKLKVKDALRDEFREKSNKWFQYQRALKAQKKMQYEEEKKKRDEEKAEYLAKIEEEEAKKIPYEEEQALCDYLAEYLERTYISKDGDKDDGKKDDVVAPQDDPFAGLLPVSKKKEEEDYFGKGKSKKKRVRTAKKQDQPGPFKLSVDIFDQFGLIQMTPPTSLEQVDGSIKALREKKEWYKQQPRGSVPTAAEIRKSNEKAAAKLKQTEDNGGNDRKPKSNKAGFSLSNDEFVPLGAAGAAPIGNASWGKSMASAQEAS